MEERTTDIEKTIWTPELKNIVKRLKMCGLHDSERGRFSDDFGCLSQRKVYTRVMEKTRKFDPAEIEALATSVMGPQPETDDEGTVHWYWRGQRHREDGPATEWSDGSKEWLRNGQRHREDGPACEWASGDKSWYQNGELHREDGPAIEQADGRKSWWRNGLFHRDDGPAVERENGDKMWFRNGQRHRDDGPAVEYADGYKAWWRNGVRVEPFTESILMG